MSDINDFIQSATQKKYGANEILDQLIKLFGLNPRVDPTGGGFTIADLYSKLSTIEDDLGKLAYSFTAISRNDIGALGQVVLESNYAAHKGVAIHFKNIVGAFQFTVDQCFADEFGLEVWTPTLVYNLNDPNRLLVGGGGVAVNSCFIVPVASGRRYRVNQVSAYPATTADLRMMLIP